MTGPRLLVTGGGGQLGRELARAVPDAFVFDRRQLDVTDRTGTARAVAAYRPDVIVHAAAMTDVDGCELDPDRAFAVNALATRWVVEAADRIDARVILASTDFVFDGSGRRPLTEWDPTGPLSVYGRSKSAAESELRPCDTVVRTAWLSGAYGPNIVRTVLGLADGDTTLRFVDDQVGSPSFTFDVAASILEIASTGVTGVVHAVNAGAVSWFEFVREILEAAGRSPDLVEPIATSELAPRRPAPRPAYSALDCAVIGHSGLTPLPDHREALARLVHQLTGSVATPTAMPRPLTPAAIP